MDLILRRLRDINAASLGVTLVLFGFLLLAGADGAARASLLGCVLSLLCVVAFVSSSRRSILLTLRQNWLSLLAGAGFLALTLMSAAPAAWFGLAPHPAWSEGASNASVSLAPYRTLEGVAAFLAPASAFLIGALLNGESLARDWTGRWLVTTAGLYAFAALYLFFDAGVGGQGGRLDVAIGSANVAAALFGFLCIAAAALMARGARGRLDTASARLPLPSNLGWASFALRAPVSLAVFVLLASCLLLTNSRGGLIASAAALLLFAILLMASSIKRSPFRNSAVLAPFAAIALLLALLFWRGGQEVLARFALAGEDMEVRRTLADAHWAVFLERPLIGHGLNTFHELDLSALNEANYSALHGVGSAHNIFIQALEEGGVLGLGLLALMLAPVLARAGARVIARGSSVEWAAAAIAGACLFFFHGAVDFALQTPAVAALFAFCLGAWSGRAART